MSAVAANVRPFPVQGTEDLARDILLRIAAARGCRHYAPLLPSDTPPDDMASLPHEVLGAALLRGPADVATFQAIRWGAMVLSDLGNSPQRIIEASHRFGVASRTAHIARTALAAGDHPEFWTPILNALSSGSDEKGVLPGLSRFVSESPLTRMGRIPVRVWLRTNYQSTVIPPPSEKPRQS